MRIATEDMGTNNVDLKDFLFMLVRREDIPSNSEESKELAAITGREVEDTSTLDVFYYGKNLMIERGYVLEDVMANKTMAAYVGRPNR